MSTWGPLVKENDWVFPWALVLGWWATRSWFCKGEFTSVKCVCLFTDRGDASSQDYHQNIKGGALQCYYFNQHGGV